MKGRLRRRANPAWEPPREPCFRASHVFLAKLRQDRRLRAMPAVAASLSRPSSRPPAGSAFSDGEEMGCQQRPDEGNIISAVIIGYGRLKHGPEMFSEKIMCSQRPEARRRFNPISSSFGLPVGGAHEAHMDDYWGR